MSLLKKYKAYVVAAVITTAAFTACGTDSHHFRLEGRFLNINRGEFYVYSPDGAIQTIDTIKIEGGRFGYEIPCEEEGTILIIMPNYSVLPIFTQPGKTIDMKADATHISEIKVTGTEENEEFYEWKKSVESLSPPQQKKQAEDYIRKHPYSIVSRWLLRNYFIATTDPDIKKVKALIAIMQKKGEENAMLSRLSEDVAGMAATQKGDRIPSFSATDINGKTVTTADYSSGKTIVLLWASWNYDGINMHRMLKSKLRDMARNGKKQPKILSICIDASKADTRNSLKYDSISWHVVSDGKMWDSPIVKAFGFSNVPDNVVIDNGTITARHKRMDEIIKELGE